MKTPASPTNTRICNLTGYEMGSQSPFPWCLVAIEKKGWLFTARIPEMFAYKAQEQGWTVIARDTDIDAPIEPSQSNPRRDVEDDCG